MKTTYLLAVFIALTVAFFYFISNVILGIAQNQKEGPDLKKNNVQYNSSAASTSTNKNQKQTNFQGPPKIKPGEGFIGPPTNPPSY